MIGIQRRFWTWLIPAIFASLCVARAQSVPTVLPTISATAEYVRSVQVIVGETKSIPPGYMYATEYEYLITVSMVYDGHADTPGPWLTVWYTSGKGRATSTISMDSVSEVDDSTYTYRFSIMLRKFQPVDLYMVRTREFRDRSRSDDIERSNTATVVFDPPEEEED